MKRQRRYKMPQLHLTLFDSLEYFSWNNGLFVVRFWKQQSLFSHIRKLVFIWILMIYLKICADSKQDDIKCERVIFTCACLRSTIMSMWVFPPVKFGVGGRGRDLKNCAYLWKKPFYVLVLYCIHHLWAPLYQVNVNKLKSQGEDLNSASGKMWV